MENPISDDNIEYTAPPEDYQPPVGGMQQHTAPGPPTISGYHDLPFLEDLLEKIINETNQLRLIAEKSMSNYNLLTSIDSRLTDAQAIEWPTQFGDPKEYISYDQYKTFGLLNTRGSAYIRKSYVDKIRGPAGTNSIDIINVANIIQQEALHVKDFIKDAIGSVNDTAEFRAIELFQDWANSALRDTRDFRNFFEKGGKNLQTIPVTEMDQVTGDQASQYQAVFQVKLNIINQEIDTLNSDLTKHTGSLADVFFKRYLGPSLKMKLRVTNDLDQFASNQSFLGVQAAQASKGLTVDYVQALTDQLSRNSIYNQKISTTKDRLVARDTYVGFIRQLSQKGTTITSPFIAAQATSETGQDWSVVASAITSAVSTQNQFESAHAALQGADDPVAHPQYMLKAGDTLTGDILADAGITVDGVDIDTHAHTGSDGTSRISGFNLAFGTLPTTAVDTTPPTTPANLKLELFQTRIIPPGIFSIEATLGWQGNSKNTYEIQIVKE